MSVIMAEKHNLVLPDGTIQALEWPPRVAEGDLIGSAEVGCSDEPAGKLVVREIEVRRPDEGPRQIYYYLEPF